MSLIYTTKATSEAVPTLTLKPTLDIKPPGQHNVQADVLGVEVDEFDSVEEGHDGGLLMNLGGRQNSAGGTNNDDAMSHRSGRSRR